MQLSLEWVKANNKYDNSMGINERESWQKQAAWDMEDGKTREKAVVDP